ncbi:MAG: S41 family peptidase [Defluviitaleaceae bacterium]|nr:S41 family peptidase [Defluviitaleaceae bacterium]
MKLHKVKETTFLRKILVTNAICLVVLAILFSFASCGRGVYEGEDYYTAADDATSEATELEPYIYDEESAAEDVIAEDNGESIPAYISPLLLTTEHFLEDLDHMLYVMQNNFALFDVAYWARGVDIYAVIDAIREAVLANPEMTVDEFFDVFFRQYSELWGIGHFSVISPERYSIILNEPAGAVWRRFYTFSAIARLREPHVAALYELLHTTRVQDEERWAHDLAARASALTEQEIREDRTYARLIARGVYELAGERLQSLLAADASEILRLSPYVNEALSNNVTTRIIEEGRIAYLAIDSFFMSPMSAQWSSDESQIYNFYDEIRDFDHLIVDLRFNGGGTPDFFYRTILEPNIGRTFAMEGFVFLSGGEYGMRYSRISSAAPIIPVDGSPRSMDTNIRPIAEMLEAYDIPDLKLSDMERMDYGFRIQTTFRTRAHYPDFGHGVTFPGNIWLLTGPMMFSAAEISARAAQETGIATLVGDVTGGAFGGPRTIITLPNSITSPSARDKH